MLFNFGGGGSFTGKYRCYPVTFIDKANLEYGDKVCARNLAETRIDLGGLNRTYAPIL